MLSKHFREGAVAGGERINRAFDLYNSSALISLPAVNIHSIYKTNSVFGESPNHRAELIG